MRSAGFIPSARESMLSVLVRNRPATVTEARSGSASTAARAPEDASFFECFRSSCSWFVNPRRRWTAGMEPDVTVAHVRPVVGAYEGNRDTDHDNDDDVIVVSPALYPVCATGSDKKDADPPEEDATSTSAGHTGTHASRYLRRLASPFS